MRILDLLNRGPPVSCLILHAAGFVEYQIFPKLIIDAVRSDHLVSLLGSLIQILAVALVKPRLEC